MADAARGNADMLAVTVTVGTGSGSPSEAHRALRHRTVRINKAWKRDGEDNEQETPSWLKRA